MSAAGAIIRNSATRTAAVVLVISIAISTWLAWKTDEARASSPPDEVLYLQSPRVVRYLSLGYTGLAACIYWTRAVQYFGEKSVAKARRFDLLLPLLNLTVSLDPHLDAAYTFGGIFLAQPPPFGAGLPDTAVDFVERGVKDNPNDWRLYYHLGFIHYMERHDYRAAADAFARGNKVVGSPPWMNGMPALMLQRAGDIETARVLWTRMYEGTEDEAVRKNALTRLAALRVDDDVTHLEQMTDSFRQRTGRYPQDWGELIAQRWLPGVPLDPSRTPYRLLSDGKVVVQDPMKFPFITKGIPEGRQAPNFIPAEPQKSQEKR